MTVEPTWTSVIPTRTPRLDGWALRFCYRIGGASALRDEIRRQLLNVARTRVLWAHEVAPLRAWVDAEADAQTGEWLARLEPGDAALLPDPFPITERDSQ